VLTPEASLPNNLTTQAFKQEFFFFFFLPVTSSTSTLEKRHSGDGSALHLAHSLPHLPPQQELQPPLCSRAVCRGPGCRLSPLAVCCNPNAPTLLSLHHSRKEHAMKREPMNPRPGAGLSTDLGRGHKPCWCFQGTRRSAPRVCPT